MILKPLFMAVAIALLAGCETQPAPTPQEVATFDYGAPPPTGYKTAIMAYFKDTLKDPYTAHIDILQPERFSYESTRFADDWNGGNRNVGWIVKVVVNAKNSYGGYVGNQVYGFFYKNGVLARAFSPDDFPSPNYSSEISAPASPK